MNRQSPLSNNFQYALFSILLSLFGSLITFSQEIAIRAQLEEQIKESSGLIYVNDMLFTHTDSDGAAALYQIDLDSNLISRSIEIQNAINVDWEDIAFDDTYIYIADFGNNVGNRRDLTIYKIPISDIEDTNKNKVNAQIINFSYANQTDFSPSPYDTNFDAEALICYKGNLFIFTKNWSNFKTDVYKLTTEPGDRSIEKIDSLEINGLISGGIFNPLSDEIILTGYSEDNAFIVTISDIIDDSFSTRTVNKVNLEIPSGTSYQVEGIAYISENQYIISSESGIFGTGALMDLTFEEILGTEKFEKSTDSIYPNPAKEYLNVSFEDFKLAEIYNSEGKKLKKSKTRKIFVGDLSSGIYVIKIDDGKHNTKSFKFIID